MFNSTFAIIKPHVIEEEKTIEILACIIQMGYVIRRLETRCITLEEAKELYAEHVNKNYFDGLCNRTCEGPVMIIELYRPLLTSSLQKCWKKWREDIGNTDPSMAYTNSLRRQFGHSVQYNALHGSDSEESAKRELEIFWPK